MATTAPDDELPRGIARVWSEDGRVTGGGFLIAERTLCTCAHVVASALGTDETASEPPVSPVTLDFPLLSPPSARLRATVTHWRPVTADGGGDIALLGLEEAVGGTTPVRFAGGTAVWDHPFRVLGFPSRTDDHGVWVDGRLRAPVGKGWTSMEARPSPAGPAIGHGFSGAPVWDTGQGGVVGMTVAAETGTGATTAYLIPAALLLGLDSMLCPSPFRGLEPFREQDAAVFFARRADSERIAEALRGHPFVPLAGASGVGKSSLVRAGVLPLLRASGHTVTDFAGQPDVDPVRTLVEALAGQFPSARDLARRLTGDRESAVLLGARILEHCGPAGHVILLDQFEETVGARPADARALLDVILPMTRATHRTGRRLRALATLRSASLEELVAGGRAEDLSGTVQMIAPMTPSQLDEVVRRPVDTVPGVEFEPGLAELVVADAGTEPGALPLVEFALAELWDRQEHGRLTHAAYREIGGVEGALSRYADHQLAQVCKSPDGPDETTARRLFERLARPTKGKEYARVARAFGSLPPELRTAAQALAGTRLLVIARDSSGRETVALAHEALVRQWPTLRGWLDTSREFLAWHEKLRGRVREWEKADRHSDLLLRGRELAAAKTYAVARPAELSLLEAGFVRLSRQHQKRSVRRGRTGVALLVCLALMVMGLGYGLWNFLRDKDRTRKDAAARQLVELAQERMSTDPVEAALLALAARRTSDNELTRAAVLRQELPLASLDSVHRIFPAGRATSMAASADGARMVVLHEHPQRGKRVFLVVGLDRGRPERVDLRDWPDAVDRVAISDDGTTIAAAAGDGQVRIWFVGKRTAELRAAPDEKPTRWKWGADPTADRTTVLDFSSDGRGLVHGVVDEESGGGCFADDLGTWTRVVRWDRATRKLRDIKPRDGLLRQHECADELALRSAADDGLMVIARSDLGAPQAPSVYAVRGAGAGADREHLAEADFGADGRAVVTRRQNEPWWQVRRLSTGRADPGAGRWPGEDFRTDLTGRYVTSDESIEDISGTGTPEDVLVQDLATGSRYSLVLPGSLALPDMCAGREVPGALHLFCPAGRNVLVFRATKTDRPLGGHALGSLNAVDRVPDIDVTAVTYLWSPFPDGTGRHAHVAVFGPRTARHTKIALKPTDEGEQVRLSHDGSRALVWRTDGWELHRTATLGNGDKQTPPPGRRWRIEDVQPYGSRDFLVLEPGGVSVIDGEGGTQAPLPGVRCAHRSLDTHRCVTVVGRPGRGHEQQVFVLRADGTAELWRQPRGGHPTTTRFSTVDSVDGPRVVFRPDGGKVAVGTGTGVELWRPADRKPVRLAADASLDGPYDRKGRLLLTVEDRTELWYDTGKREPRATLDGSRAYWRFEGHLLRGFAQFGPPLVYDLGRLDDGSLAPLCGLLGPSPYPVRDILVSAGLDVLPGADMTPPCAKPH